MMVYYFEDFFFLAMKLLPLWKHLLSCNSRPHFQKNQISFCVIRGDFYVQHKRRAIISAGMCFHKKKKEETAL